MVGGVVLPLSMADGLLATCGTIMGCGDGGMVWKSFCP